MRVSKPVGIGTGLFAGTLFAALLVGDGFTRGLLQAFVVGAIGFGVTFFLETRRPSDGE